MGQRHTQPRVELVEEYCNVHYGEVGSFIPAPPFPSSSATLNSQSSDSIIDCYRPHLSETEAEEGGSRNVPGDSNVVGRGWDDDGMMDSSISLSHAAGGTSQHYPTTSSGNSLQSSVTTTNNNIRPPPILSNHRRHRQPVTNNNNQSQRQPPLISINVMRNGGGRNWHSDMSMSTGGSAAGQTGLVRSARNPRLNRRSTTTANTNLRRESVGGVERRSTSRMMNRSITGGISLFSDVLMNEMETKQLRWEQEAEELIKQCEDATKRKSYLWTEIHQTLEEKQELEQKAGRVTSQIIQLRKKVDELDQELAEKRGQGGICPTCYWLDKTEHELSMLSFSSASKK